MEFIGWTAGVGVAFCYLGLFALIAGASRFLRLRRWRRDAQANLALSLARTDDGTNLRTYDVRTGTVSDVGTYYRQYRNRPNDGPARPRTVHRDHLGAGVVLGAAVGAPHSADAPPVVGAP